MLPWKSIFSTSTSTAISNATSNATSTSSYSNSCIPLSNLLALMSTAVAITAAATFWCTRRFTSKPSLIIKSQPQLLSATTAVSSIDNGNYEALSFLCNSCGLQKYSQDELEAIKSSESGKSPFKMVILVRTDLNMVKLNHLILPPSFTTLIITLILGERKGCGSVLPCRFGRFQIRHG